MLLGNEQFVKAVFRLDERIEVLEHLELFAWDYDV